jgi:hypothetical protein
MARRCRYEIEKRADNTQTEGPIGYIDFGLYLHV